MCCLDGVHCFPCGYKCDRIHTEDWWPEVPLYSEAGPLPSYDQTHQDIQGQRPGQTICSRRNKYSVWAASAVHFLSIHDTLSTVYHQSWHYILRQRHAGCQLYTINWIKTLFLLTGIVLLWCYYPESKILKLRFSLLLAGPMDTTWLLLTAPNMAGLFTSTGNQLTSIYSNPLWQGKHWKILLSTAI